MYSSYIIFYWVTNSMVLSHNTTMPKSKKPRKKFAGSEPTEVYVAKECDRQDLVEESKNVHDEISELEFKLEHDCGCYICIECVDTIVAIKGLQSRIAEVETALEDLDSGRNGNSN